MGFRRFVVPLIAAVCALGPLTACTADGSPPPAAAVGPQDPLTTVDDGTSGEFVNGHLPPVLHRQGVGSGTFSVDRPSGARGIRFYVACSPDSHFTVTMGTFYSGPCAATFQNAGEIPVGAGPGPLKVSLDLPSGARYWILGIPVEASPPGS